MTDAMKQALDFINTMPYQHNPEAIRVSTALRAAIEAAEKQEPDTRFAGLDYATPQPAIPAGYALVPVEPTPEMVERGEDAYNEWENGHCVEPIYKAMLAAAPKEQK